MKREIAKRASIIRCGTQSRRSLGGFALLSNIDTPQAAVFNYKARFTLRSITQGK
jgi:hypothetical protein